MTPRLLFAFLLVIVFQTSTFGAEPLKSGLQPEDRVTAIFEPLNVTGPYAGDPHCLVCENGLNPVAMIFARTASESLVKLLGKIDAATGEHRDVELGSFVVFLSEQEGLDQRLKEIAKKHRFQHIILSTFAPAGPDGFRVAQESDVTVVFYRDYVVKANHAFRAGELNDLAVEKIVRDLPKIVSGKPKPK